MGVYAFVDVSHKQEYIYRNNQLKHNLYNSFVIKTITENMPDLAGDSQYRSVTLNKFLDKHGGEFVFSGGGNSILRFETLEHARQFVRGYSERVLCEYPGMELYISIVDACKEDGTERSMQEIRKRLFQQADQLKDKRRAAFKRWSYGIEKIGETGLPVLAQVPQIDSKYSKKYLQSKLEQALREKLPTGSVRLTDELSSYKKSEGTGKSYIGVIVIDGNRMGEMADQASSFEQLQLFSNTIEALYLEAVANGLEEIAQDRSPIDVTPVVLAGDDICLVVPADIAVELAAAIVKKIEYLSQDNCYFAILAPFMKDSQRLKACAGVAIARYNYPFFELVRTAESRSKHAKEAIYRIHSSDRASIHASFIDWEIVQRQADGGHRHEELVRHENYKERFHVKPLRLDTAVAEQNGIFGYEAYASLIRQLITETASGESESKLSKSFLEQIRKVMYAGYDQYKLFLEMKQTSDVNRLVNIVRHVYDQANLTVWAHHEPDQGKVYTYLLNDALEIMPFFSRKQKEVMS